MSVRVFFILALLLFTSSVLQVARCEPDPDAEVVESAEEGGDLGIVGEDVQDFGGGSFSPAPGVETVCVFPKNPSKFVVAGEESELLVGIKNEGESSINVIAIQASVHLPFDHQYLVQNLSAQAFNNASVPPSAQATFPYIFGVSKFLQSGAFDLVGTIVYEIDQHPYQSTFYNGTIEVAEPGGMFSVESVFLFCLGVALLALLGFWIRSQIQQLSKKTKRAQRWKLELGQLMPQWMSGCRELHMVNLSPTNQRRRSRYVRPNCNVETESRAIITMSVVHSFFFFLSLFVAVSLCNADHDKILKVVGTAHCADCKDFNFKITHSFSGLHVSIDCKLKNGDVKRVAAGELDQQGNFNVPLPQELVEDGRTTLKEECYAQLHSAAAVPCPAHNGLEASKIVFKSQANGITSFGPSKNLQFSAALCTSKFFWPYFKFPPLPKITHPWKKNFGHPWFLPPFPPVYDPNPLPPPAPIYEPPVVKPVPPPTPVYEPPVVKPLPPPPPVYEPPAVKPLPPPVPIYKPKPPVVKPLPPPVPVYKPKPPVIEPLPPPVPIYKPKPPVYSPPKKPCPPKQKPPVYKPPVVKPLPPPVPHYKPKPPVIKPLPPPVPIYKPKPPVYIPPKKPCPPIKPNPPVYKPPVAKPLPPPVPIYKPPVVKPLLHQFPFTSHQ
ncbi:UNVERIFIED_CONTAM: Translocon-associated protein subunit alpha [Sesamum angustifolium]|uniref:Translocon-associated protein subunit alpha n=1 Tax=Sesamum angustifolium TaxID=2727405 RepID=A0AAW2QDB0_9LAMI